MVMEFNLYQQPHLYSCVVLDLSKEYRKNRSPDIRAQRRLDSKQTGKQYVPHVFETESARDLTEENKHLRQQV